VQAPLEASGAVQGKKLAQHLDVRFDTLKPAQQVEKTTRPGPHPTFYDVYADASKSVGKKQMLLPLPALMAGQEASHLP
jgi:hypothetical protein